MDYGTVVWPASTLYASGGGPPPLHVKTISLVLRVRKCHSLRSYPSPRLDRGFPSSPLLCTEVSTVLFSLFFEEEWMNFALRFTSFSKGSVNERKDFRIRWFYLLYSIKYSRQSWEMFEREAEPKWNNGFILFTLGKKNKFVKNQNFRNILTSVHRSNLHCRTNRRANISYLTAISPISFSQRKYFLCLW